MQNGNYNLLIYPACLSIDTEPDGVKATCISSGSDFITVAVNYTNGCRRDLETVVEASGVACKPLLTAPTTTTFECGPLFQNSSYNITAHTNGHVDSVTCSTMANEQKINDLS